VKESKRLLLEALLGEPGRGWTRSQLARASGQHSKARMDLHLSPLVDAGFLRRAGDLYRLVPDQPVTAALKQLLRELGASLPS
jgi:hypothetical protein